MIHSMMDITDRKEAERLKSDFVSFVSHQLRTPLSGMNWLLELAADIDDLPGAAREYITDARASAQRLVTLVNDLLDIARVESGRSVAQPEPVGLEELTHSVLSELQTLVAHRAHAIEVLSSPAAPVWADRQLIRQVVMNLLSNAIKYTPAGGRISISCRQENGTVQWGVQDNGVGVPRAAQARLFERFFRADNATAMEVEGTGLGLHLVRLIVEQAGGRVWCESEEGRGAMFAFTWPAHGGSVS
jgi:signal transduction histidine kinase